MNPLHQLPAPLLAWFEVNKRDLPWRKDKDPYHVWVSEIMLQQTRVEAVRGYYLRFMTALPTVEALADAPEEQLLKLWEGLGYYNRARNLQKCAKVIVAEYGGNFPRDYATLLTLPGIGAYTAGAIASICFDLPCPAVDGNVLRVTARILGDSTPIETPAFKKQIFALWQEAYPKANCGDFTQSLMELGATVCLPNGQPKCGLCPVADHCTAKAQQLTEQIPAHLEKRKRKQEEKTVFLLRCGDKIAIRKRPAKGLLAGLWELPNIENKSDAQSALGCVREWGCQPVSLLRSFEKVHIFTHIEWHMTCYEIECDAMPEEFLWCSAQEVEQTYSLPTAFRMFLEG